LKKRGDAFLDNLFFPVPFDKARGIPFTAKGEVIESRDDALQFRVEFFVLERRQFFQRDLENVAVRSRGDRQLVVVITKEEDAGVEAQF